MDLSHQTFEKTATKATPDTDIHRRHNKTDYAVYNLESI